MGNGGWEVYDQMCGKHWGGGHVVCVAFPKYLIFVPFAMEHLSELMFQEKLWEITSQKNSM